MDASRQPSTHGDGLLDMRELARTLLEPMANEVMDAQADMPCGDGANARNGYRERGLATPVGDITPRIPKLRVLMFTKKWSEWSPLLEHRGH